MLFFLFSFLHGTWETGPIDQPPMTLQQCAAPETWCKSRFGACSQSVRLTLKKRCCTKCVQTSGCRPFPYCATCCFVVNGGWSAWGRCTKRCGGGVRFRSCSKPAPRNGGAKCQGDSVQECNQWTCAGIPFATQEAAYVGACHNEKNDARWARKCRLLGEAIRHPRTGNRVRHAFCNNQKPEWIKCARACGRCRKSTKHEAIRAAKAATCRDWGNHKAKQRCADLTRAMRDVEHGSQVRARFCKPGTSEYKHCRLACCVLPQCKFDACNAPTPAPSMAPDPTGLMSWFRVGAKAGKTATRKSERVDGGWTEWGACERTCGAATQTRTCSSPIPRGGGKPCRGPYRQWCLGLPPCPVDGKWSAWGPCSHTCGGFEMRAVRVRRCNNPAPAHGGRLCAGETQKACAMKSCPVDGRWGDWSPCSAPCGGGTEQRRCDAPHPHFGGRSCMTLNGSRSLVEERACNEQLCKLKVNGQWGSWSTCSTSCGQGKQTRSCNRPSPQNGGLPCHGDKMRKCEIKPCAIDGGWSNWGSCSATCGDGMRVRVCDQPRPRFGGKYCDGPSEHLCGEKPCPVDGGWSDWGGCSKQCADVDFQGNGGKGKVLPGVQVRSCTMPKPVHGGRACTGIRQRACNIAPCARYRRNGGWTAWGQCSKTCGSGLMLRSCTSPSPRFGGTKCAGQKFKFCNQQPCPRIDGGWSSWSNCVVECGADSATGTQTRSCTHPAPVGGGLPCRGAASRQCLGDMDAACPQLPHATSTTRAPQHGGKSLQAVLRGARRKGETARCGADDDDCQQGAVLAPMHHRVASGAFRSEDDDHVPTALKGRIERSGDRTGDDDDSGDDDDKGKGNAQEPAQQSEHSGDDDGDDDSGATATNQRGGSPGTVTFQGHAHVITTAEKLRRIARSGST